MTEQQGRPEGTAAAENQQKPVVVKKKASWLHTILWMLSMMLLVNVVMAIIAYVLHRMKVF